MVAHGWLQLTALGGLLLFWIVRANLRNRTHSAGNEAAKEKLS